MVPQGGIFVLATAFLLSFIIGRPMRRSTPRTMPPQMTHEDAYQMLLNKPFFLDFEEYTLTVGEPCCYYLLEIWLNILHHLPGMTLWDMGLTCKWFGALIRTRQMNLCQKWRDQNAIEEILLFSQLPLSDGMWYIIKPIVKQMIPDSFEFDYDRLESEKKTVLNEFVKSFIERPCGPFILQLVAQRSGLVKTREYVGLLAAEHMYTSADKLYYHYLPPAGIKILDTIHTRVLGLMMSSVESCRQHQMFAMTIMAEYLLPAFNERRNITKREVEILQDLNPSLRFAFDDCLKLILWALFLGYDDVDKGKSPRLRVIIKFLKNVGLIWGEIRSDLPMKCGLEKMLERKEVPDMNAILLFAKYWYIGYKQVAKRTKSWCELSRQIDDDEAPERFINHSLPSSLELYKLVYGEDPVPMTINVEVPSHVSSIPLIEHPSKAKKLVIPKAKRLTQKSPPKKKLKVDESWKSFETPVMNNNEEIVPEFKVTRKRGRSRKTRVNVEEPMEEVTEVEAPVLRSDDLLLQIPLNNFYIQPVAQQNIFPGLQLSGQIIRNLSPPIMVPQPPPIQPATEVEEDMNLDWKFFLEPEYRDD